MGKRRPTSADVASLAGVSRATVSYVLNDSPKQSIPQATRERVWAAAHELGYTPNAAAKALRAGQSNLVLLAVRDTPSGRNVGLMVDRLAARATEMGLTLVTWQGTSGQELGTALSHLHPRAVISPFPMHSEEIRLLEAAKIPHVSGETDSGNERATLLQMRHLADLGHHKIGYLGTDDAELMTFSGPRLVGARRAAAELGLAEPSEHTATVPPQDSFAAVRAQLQEWTTGANPVTAVACYNDYLAAETIAAAQSLGIRIPDDLSVMGIDDEPLSAFLTPPLTTIAFDMTAYADHLMDRGLNNGPAAESDSWITVIARDSTGPAPG